MQVKVGKKGEMVDIDSNSGFTYLVGKEARGSRAGSGRGMVHSGVRPAAFRGPRVRSRQLNRPPSATCSTPTWLGLILGPRRAIFGPGESSDGGE